MNFSTVTILIIIGLIAFVAFFFFLMFYTTARYHQKINKILAELGFIKNDADKKLVTEKFLIAIEQNLDKKAVVINLHKKQLSKYNIYVCEYHSMSSSGKSRGADWLLAGIVSQDLKVPRFSVKPIPQLSGLVGKILQSFSSNFSISTLHKIQTSNSKFNNRFNLYAKASLTAEEIISERIMNYLLSAGNVELEANDDTLVFFNIDIEAERLAKKIDSNKIKQLIDLTQKVTEELLNKKTS